MVLQALYLIVVCHVGAAPCPAPFFKKAVAPQDFHLTREKCLAAARGGATVDRAAYCAGNDGSILSASGRVVPEQEYYDAVNRWMAARERVTPSPSISATAR